MDVRVGRRHSDRLLKPDNVRSELPLSRFELVRHRALPLPPSLWSNPVLRNEHHQIHLLILPETQQDHLLMCMQPELLRYLYRDRYRRGCRAKWNKCGRFHSSQLPDVSWHCHYTDMNRGFTVMCQQQWSGLNPEPFENRHLTITVNRIIIKYCHLRSQCFFHQKLYIIPTSRQCPKFL